jgi:signal transduction histidine kinase
MKLLANETSNDEIWKYKVAQNGLGIASAIISIRFISDLILLGPSIKANYITLFAAIFYGCLFIFVKKTKSYKNPVFAGLLSAFSIIYIRAEVTGGLNSPIMSWFAVLPIISSFILSKKQTYIISALSVFTITLISTRSLVPWLDLTVTELPILSKVLMYSSVIVLSTFICLIHEDKRMKMLKQIERQKLNLLSSSRYTELGEIAAGIAHEINNPLTVLKVKAKKIRRKAEVNSELEDIIVDADKILLMTERINKIIKSMKNLSKNPLENDSTRKEEFEKVLENVVTLCEAKVKYSNILLKIEKENFSIGKALIPSQLGHVFLNLINNACDAISENKEKWIKVNANIEGNFLIFSITDSGNGIQKSEREKIFNPFYTDKEVGQGTGLGLSISRNIIESLGGSFYLDINHPHTCFKIIIPYEEYSDISLDQSA